MHSTIGVVCRRIDKILEQGSVMLQEFIVLGLVPGTNIEVPFDVIFFGLLAAGIGYEALRIYAFRHYAVLAKLRNHRAEQLLQRHGLL